MAGLVGTGVCQRVRLCWTRRRSWASYQRLPAPLPATPRRLGGRGVRLSRRTTVLGSAARRFGRRLRHRAAASARWASPLQLLNRVVDAYVTSLLSQPLKALSAGGSSSPGAAPPPPSSSSSPTKLRRDASSSPPGSSRRRDAGGRGVVLNICVAEALMLRRSTSEVRPSPLQQAREAARCTSVRA